MIAPQNEEILRILDLVRQQQTNGFQTLFAAVDIIAQKDVIRFRWESPVFEQSQQIVVLTVHITTNLDGGFQFQQHRLSNQQIPAPQTQHLDFGFGQINLLPRTSPADTVEGAESENNHHNILTREELAEATGEDVWVRGSRNNRQAGGQVGKTGLWWAVIALDWTGLGWAG